MKVLVTQAIDESALQRLREEVEVDLRVGDAPIERAELLQRVRGCQGLLCMLTDRVDSEVLDAGPLRAVANHAVGVDNIDLEAARQRGVVVTNTPGVLTEATADLAFALLLAAARRIAEGDRYVRAGRWKGWAPTLMRGLELHGSRLGIVGQGRIGSAVARRARAFGMEVVHCSRSSGVPLDELLSTSDVVSLHCPLTPETRGLLGEAELRAMKPTAVLVNTARGPVVDEAALVRALTQGWIAAAGLDVFEAEPSVHSGLLTLDNVVLAPHVGSATYATRGKMGHMCVDDLLLALGGERPERALTQTS